MAKSYIGFDFSEVAVEFAIRMCPEYKFYDDDALKSRLFDSKEDDRVLTAEFIKHIEEDISVMYKIRSRT